MIQEEKLEKGLVLPIMEHFYTLQGEGTFSGTAAYFIRIGGCDVGCHFCDVKESWDASKHPVMEVEFLLAQIPKEVKTVIVTGGEPLNWNLDFLTHSLNKRGIKTHIETSGSSPLSGNWNWICLSPKKTKLPLSEIYPLASELKMIIQNTDDFRFAQEQALKVDENCKLLLQPEWSRRDKMMPLITDYVMKNPKWRASLQTHKYMNIP